MKKKGFTLIELLAVIVILAIIALIATPAVLNLIEDSRKNAVESSARNISKTAETYYVQHTLLHNERVGEIDLTTDTLNYKGDKPYKGYVYFDDKGNAYLKMYQNGYCIVSDYDNTVNSVKMESKECEIKSIIIFIDLDGGKLDDSVLEYEQGDTYGELPAPTRDGNTFIGWFDKSGNPITADTVIDKSSTIYAKWEPNIYTVTLSLPNETIPETEGWEVVEGVPTKKITYDTEYGLLPEPIKTGYTFTGWYTSGGFKINPNSFLIIPNDHTLTGQFEPNKYVLTYVYNNGDADTTETVTYDTKYNLPTPTRIGYTFLGWYDGTTKVENNSVVKILEDKTFEAKWEANKYNVTFKYNDEKTSDTVKEVTYDLNYGELPAPTRVGYEFLGWYDGDIEVSSTTVVNIIENQTLEGRWIANTYEVTFVYGNGTSNTSKEVTYDNTYGTLPNPSRTGYTFQGWYDGSTKVESSATVKITSNQILEGKWTANTYTVTFVYDNGSANTTANVTYDGSYSLPEPTKTGYIFQGWFTDDNVSITSEMKVNIASNHTLTAKWSQNGYTVTYNANGGSVSPSSGSVAYDNAYGTLPNPSRAGYTFSGWFTAASGGTLVTESTKVTTASNHSIYAQWKANTYTVTFVYGNGSANTTATVTYNGTYTLPSASRTGYTFKAWATTGGVAVTSSTKVTTASNHTLTAQWTAITYKVAYNANGGSGSMTTVTHTYDTAKNLTANTFKRTGYTFNGWNTKADGTGTSYANSASVKNLTATNNATVTLYAKWTAITYKVAYNANGGTGTMSAVTHTYDTAKTLTANTFKRTGYTFNGWNTKADGTGTSYVNSASVKNLSSTSGATVTLYAQWTANTYKISFDANGGTTSTVSKNIVYSKTYGTLPTPSRTGFTFKGWYLNETSTSAIVSTNTMNTASNHTLYAQWTINSSVSSGTVVYFNPVTGKKCLASNSVSVWKTKDGCMRWYVFLDVSSNTTLNLLLDHNTSGNIAWNTNSSGTTPVTALTQLNSDVANWNSNIKSTARLIKATEIVSLTGKTNWSTSSSYYYFQNNSTTEYKGAAGTNKYGWLFDNTANCTTWGCNVQQSGTAGYWTDTYRPSGGAWTPNGYGSLTYGSVTISNTTGVRPVITVSKDVFK